MDWRCEGEGTKGGASAESTRAEGTPRLAPALQPHYEVTRDMRTLMASRGFREGTDLLYFAFPDGQHHEGSWAMRSHLPYQFFFDHCRITPPAPSP